MQCIDVKSYMIHVKHCVCTKSTWVRTRNAALGATDFGGGYEMPGHGQWMQDYSFHCHHFKRKSTGKSWENPYVSPFFRGSCCMFMGVLCVSRVGKGCHQSTKGTCWA